MPVMEKPSSAVRVLMTMIVPMRLDRHHHNMTVAHAALGDDVIGESPHIGPAPAQYGDLKAAIVIDMHVKPGLREIVALMKILG